MNQIEIINEQNGVRKDLAGRGWSVDLISKDTCDARSMMLGISTLKAGSTTRTVVHETEELCYVISGTGAVTDGVKTNRFREHDAIYFPADVPHTIVCDPEYDVVMLFTFPTTTFPPTRILKD
ncbi:MAG: cupin domain-containing protein [Nitrososphaerota archaeon]|nr:cupin domain-containing protein [Nitrososphaerota archaeon]